jgi:hypothetical protein
MSESTTSPSNFQLIQDALADYMKQTGIDLPKHPFADQIQSCDSANAIFQLLQNKENQFQAYRDQHRKLINCLNPVVQFLHAVSGTLGEAVILVSTTESTRRLSYLYPSARRHRFHLQKQYSSALMFCSPYVYPLCSTESSS